MPPTTTFEIKNTICNSNGGNYENLVRGYQQKVADLEYQVNKTRLYEKNQYGLDWILSSTQAESLHDECTVTPAISLHGELLDPVNLAFAAHHNLYAIIDVVTALVKMENPTFAKDRAIPFPVRIAHAM